MSKIKKVLVLQDLPLRLLAQLDDKLNDLFYHFEGDLDELGYYLTEKRFIIASVEKDNFYSKDEFYILDCEELQLDAYGLTDPKNLLEDADSFTIKEYQELFSSNILISSIREKITESMEVFYDLQVFGDIDFK